MDEFVAGKVIFGAVWGEIWKNIFRSFNVYFVVSVEINLVPTDWQKALCLLVFSTPYQKVQKI